MANPLVRFLYGTLSEYKALKNKDSRNLYFTVDEETGKVYLYKGDQLFASDAIASAIADGLMSKEDKKNLDNLIERFTLVEADSHTHSNKALLDTYTQTEADIADAIAKKHTHDNADVLNIITQEMVDYLSWGANHDHSELLATDEDIAILLTNQGYITPIGTNDGTIYTDDNGKLYVL